MTARRHVLPFLVLLSTPVGALPADGGVPWSIRYTLMDQFGPPFFCDRDRWPIVHPELPRAREWYAAVDAAGPELAAIRTRLKVTTPSAALTEDELLAVYREHKSLGAIGLEPRGVLMAFTMRTGKLGERGEALAGTISAGGEIVVEERTQQLNTCPRCLARGTRIATPGGEVPVEELRPGMPVFTLDREGRKVPAVVAQVGQVAAGDDHEVVELVLASGRTLRVSPAHPLASGLPVAGLAAGQDAGGIRVLDATRVRYRDAYTYDLEPSGDTGVYFAEGVALASTLRH